ncbi:hypothetical protein EKN06_02800 [Croceicoccus ponticola]|uniref:Copper chaperone PCu(A)C n=1 Tax=Croceicoccus ponticola TaxID=2217664 RepID=A0A437H0P4_9SPHN|nr:hypothetical protein [Croceicoccus ponticola]RVQ69149.1 hypothetical protein EKN06_02800 [Croceicoccus ponticola]
MKNRFLTAALAATLVVGMSAPALAHGSMKPSHGGVVQMTGEIMFELVKTAKGVDIYLTEEDEPLAASGFDAKLIVTSAAGQKTTTALKPVTGNRFTAAGLKLGAGSKVVVALVGKGPAAKTFATFQMK